MSGGGLSAASAVNPIAAGLQAVPAAYKIGLAIKQGIEAEKLRKAAVRPVMSTPASVRQNTDMQQLLAMDTRIPGQSYMTDQIMRGHAGVNQAIMNAGGGSAERLAALVGSGANTTQALNNLANMGVQQQMQDIAALGGQLNLQGQYEQQNFDYNQVQKYNDQVDMASRLGDASNQNIYGALMDTGGAVASAIKKPSAQVPATIQPSFIPQPLQSQTPSLVQGLSIPQRPAMGYTGMPYMTSEAALQAEIEALKRLENTPSPIPAQLTPRYPSFNYSQFINR